MQVIISVRSSIGGVLLHGGVLLGVGLLAVLWPHDGQRLVQHMLLHVLLMGGVAPLLAWSVGQLRAGAWHPACFSAGLLQLAVFFAWHSPFGLQQALHSPWLAAAMQGSLLLAALWFWTTVRAACRNRPWQAVLALLLTGKSLCLLAVLWVLAPRAWLGHGGTDAALLHDQQQAGLLMLGACPLIYLGSALLILLQQVFPRPGRIRAPADG